MGGCKALKKLCVGLGGHYIETPFLGGAKKNFVLNNGIMSGVENTFPNFFIYYGKPKIFWFL